ncbi:cysteine desulfurase family protein [Shouchella tritolerans]|uniref:cysteine desulfurase family protein n=1 Tax=Shouchella tritolerans TaxID=2979466 RepID=UPI0021E79989|nr:cysteine desulfurase family protein [Shouchella tritolerans]
MYYLDYSATTPLSPLCLDVYQKTAQVAFANSNSLHTFGLEARGILEQARAKFASLLRLTEEELYFTGSGSESNFLAIVSLAFAYRDKGRHLVSTKTEHPSVLEALHYLEKHGYEITYVPVTKEGNVTVEALRACLRPDTVLASIAVASSEIGTVQDVAVLSNVLRSRGILFHSDCVQALGKIEIDFSLLDAASFSAHKLYAPKGTGAVYLSRRLHWRGFYEQARHESGFRPGTVDTPAVAAFASAVEHALSIREKRMTELADLRNTIIRQLTATGHFQLVGSKEERLPFHIGMLVEGWSGQQFMLECDRAGFAIATGSACHAGQTSPPLSLLALGLTNEQADRYVRVTLGEPTTEEEVIMFIRQCTKIVCR